MKWLTVVLIALALEVPDERIRQYSRVAGEAAQGVADEARLADSDSIQYLPAFPRGLPPMWAVPNVRTRRLLSNALVPVVSNEPSVSNVVGNPVYLGMGEFTAMNRLFSDDAIAVSCIWAEARSEPLAGKVAVAEVIRNRMRLGYFSDGSVAGTVFRPWQFSCMNTDNQWRSKIFQLDWDSPVVKECLEAWNLAKGGSASVGTAVLYYAEYIPAPRWARAEGVTLVKKIGRHLFFEDRAA